MMLVRHRVRCTFTRKWGGAVGQWTLNQFWRWKRQRSDTPYTGPLNEPVIDTRQIVPVLRVHNGSTQGGVPLVSGEGSGIITPTIISPANGATDVGSHPLLVASAFQTINTTNEEPTHLNTRFQIALDSYFTQLVYDGGWLPPITTLDCTSVGVTLSMGVTYYVRVQYRSHYGKAGLPIYYQQKLERSTKVANDYYGYAVALSSDGHRLVVGAYGVDTYGSNVGIVYVYEYEGSWVLKTTFPRLNTKTKQIGYTLAISGDGNTVAIQEGWNAQEVVSVFKHNGTDWDAGIAIKPHSLAATTGLGCGLSLSHDGSLLLIGEQYNDTTQTDSGRALIYRYQNDLWVQTGILKAPTPVNTKRYGYSVQVSPDGLILIVGEFLGTRSGTSQTCGVAYIYELVADIWVYRVKIEPSDGASNDNFCTSMTCNYDGSIIAVGSPLDDDGGSATGSVYVYTRSGNTWPQTAKIAHTGRKANDRLGIDVSMNYAGDLLAVGAQRATGNATTAGSVFLYTRSGAVWTQQMKLVAPDGATDDYFGTSVSLSNGGVLAIGAYTDDIGVSNAGSVYVFVD